jgi:hypothetical protein
MATYLVERYLPGITLAQLVAAAGRAASATTEMSDEGRPIRYVRSAFLPTEESVFCLFEGPDEDSVREANDRAGVPFDRVLEVIVLEGGSP